MERDSGVGEELNISLVKMMGALEFLIALVSKHVEMTLFPFRASKPENGNIGG